MRCPHCGRKVKDRAKTCAHCGRSLKLVREERRIYALGALMIIAILVVGVMALRYVSRGLDGSFFESGNQMLESVAEREEQQKAVEALAEEVDVLLKSLICIFHGRGFQDVFARHTLRHFESDLGTDAGLFDGLCGGIQNAGKRIRSLDKFADRRRAAL